MAAVAPGPRPAPSAEPDPTPLAPNHSPRMPDVRPTRDPTPMRKAPSVWEELTVADVVSNVFVEVATLATVFFLGAMVGSFVNVVLYRMPRRMNLLWPPSRCPACGHTLKLVDNVPVLAYRLLGGCCRFCGAAIPRDYYRVEVGFGLLFLALTYLEIHSGGSNLPVRGPNQYYGALWNLWYTKPDLVAIWLYHLLFATALGTLYLFTRRGERLPGLFVVAALVAGIGLPARVSGLHLVPLHQQQYWATTGWPEAAAGTAAGLILGSLLAFVWPGRGPQPEVPRPTWPVPTRWEPIAFLGLVGAFLGWQAAVSVLVLVAAWGVVRPQTSGAGRIVTAAAIQLVTWRAGSVYVPGWPGPQSGLGEAAAWGLAAVAVAALRPPPDPAARATDGTPARPTPLAGSDLSPATPAAPAAASPAETDPVP